MRSFDEFIAPDYPDEGITHFYANVTPDRLIAAIREGSIVLVATVDGTLAGIITIGDKTHISWLYVEKIYHARGLGRALIGRAAAQIRERTPDATVITLNSSPFAFPIYMRMGFEATDPETTQNGMRMIPMSAGIEDFI